MVWLESSFWFSELFKDWNTCCLCSWSFPTSTTWPLPGRLLSICVDLEQSNVTSRLPRLTVLLFFPRQSLASTVTPNQSAQRGTQPWATTAPRWWAASWSPARLLIVKRTRTLAGNIHLKSKWIMATASWNDTACAICDFKNLNVIDIFE